MRCGDPLVQKLKEDIGLKHIIGESPAFLDKVRCVPRFARSDATVLISGESGTGKELFARAIHYLSPRADRPFIPVNCGALPENLVESEIFGHKRGAFTGAASDQAGLIREAEGGTLFLDEIDCLTPQAQVKLLRFLQDGDTVVRTYFLDTVPNLGLATATINGTYPPKNKGTWVINERVDEMYYVLEGTGTIIYQGGDTIQLELESAVCIPRGLKYRVEEARGLRVVVPTGPAWSADQHKFC